MRRGRLPLTALRSFEAAGRAESLTLAGAELCISPAAVSRQVRELEALLGVTLFERLHRGVRLTDAGRRLLDALTTAFDGIDDALADVRPSAGTAAATVTVSVEPSFAACWLVPALADFHAAVPEATVVLEADSRIADLRGDGPVLAIRHSAARTAWPRTEARRLCESRLGVSLAPRLAMGLTGPAGLLDLPRLHEDSRGDWARWLAAVGLPAPGTETGTLFTDGGLVLQAALRGQGAALLDELFTREDVAAGRLVRPFAATIPCGAYWLVARRFDHLPPAARRFAAWLEAAVRAI